MFLSTRGESPEVGFAEAFAAGLAPDGGLYVPATLPSLVPLLARFGAAGDGAPLAYPDLAFQFFSLFDQDHRPAALKELIERSHLQFDDPGNAAPLVRLDEHTSVLELFHGPTLAFKDFGLQLVGNFFEDQIAQTGVPINVLGATSGDTGSAAIHGLAGKSGVNVFILYPKGRIAPLQERQMTCTGAPNIFPIPIEGSFDDAQKIVKSLFSDLAFKSEVGLSAVNSINLVRVLAQAVYYLYAFLQVPPGARPRLRFVVPTGNFGNVFAGWLAHKMGMAVAGFTIATNQNDILYRLFTTGAYRPDDVLPSLAPSMDIQVASNFERFLYYHQGEDGSATAATMAKMQRDGNVDIPGFNPDVFTATRTEDRGIVENIRYAFERFGYVADPHTACGFEAVKGGRRQGDETVILSTAHPAKFPETIEDAIGVHPTHPALEALKGAKPVTFSPGSTADDIRSFIQQRRARLR